MKEQHQYLLWHNSSNHLCQLFLVFHFHHNTFSNHHLKVKVKAMEEVDTRTVEEAAVEEVAVAGAVAEAVDVEDNKK